MLPPTQDSWPVDPPPSVSNQSVRHPTGDRERASRYVVGASVSVVGSISIGDGRFVFERKTKKKYVHISSGARDTRVAVLGEAVRFPNRNAYFFFIFFRPSLGFRSYVIVFAVNDLHVRCAQVFRVFRTKVRGLGAVNVKRKKCS